MKRIMIVLIIAAGCAPTRGNVNPDPQLSPTLYDQWRADHLRRAWNLERKEPRCR